MQLNKSTLIKFSELDLSPDVMKALTEIGFENPTPIQEKSIPLLKNGENDFIGLAQTGTGKTAAFGLPMLELIDANIRKTQALIVAPTRELAQQIGDQIEIFGKHVPGLRTAIVYGGGANIVPQLKELRNNPQIIIATPGRLLDVINRGAVSLKELRVVILDEADEMLNMGFKEDIDLILGHSSGDRLIWLFSATMPKEIRRIVDEYMSDPIEVKVSTGNEVNKNIVHQLAKVKTSDKMDGLKRFLDRDADMRGIIFCRTKIETQKVAEHLAKDDYKVEPLHGDMTQNLRERVMKRFKAHELQVLVATDVAARGIDVNDLTHVIHYSLPDSREYYTHRSGRTARAGKKGISLALANSREAGKLKEYEDRLNIKFEVVRVPSVEEVQKNHLASWFNTIKETEKSTHLTDELLDQAYEAWHGLEIDELIEKLVSHEVDKLNYTEDRRDLNDSSKATRGGGRERGDRDRGRGRDRDRGPRSDRGDRGDRRDRDRGDRRERSDRPNRSDRGERRDRPRDASRKSGGGDDVTFFIGLGRKDDFNESSLRDFISKKTGMKSDEITSVRMRNLNAYFDVNKKHSGTVSSSCKNLEVNGREVRVNRDNQGRD